MYSRLMFFCETRVIQLCQWKITSINSKNETDSWNNHQAQIYHISSILHSTFSCEEIGMPLCKKIHTIITNIITIILLIIAIIPQTTWDIWDFEWWMTMSVWWVGEGCYAATPPPSLSLFLRWTVIINNMILININIYKKNKNNLT